MIVWPQFGITASAAEEIFCFINNAGCKHGQSSSPVRTSVGTVSFFMSSTSDSSGSATVTITFDPEADPDIAQVQVQNKLQAATPLLPQEEQRQGVTVTKSTINFLLVLGFVSEDGKLSQVDLADYVSSNVLDPLSRVDGVGEVQLFGAQYAMRIWLDPAKLNSYQLAPLDVSNAIKAHAPHTPAIVFVPSRNQAQLTALELLTHAAADADADAEAEADASSSVASTSTAVDVDTKQVKETNNKKSGKKSDSDSVDDDEEDYDEDEEDYDYDED